MGGRDRPRIKGLAKATRGARLVVTPHQSLSREGEEWLFTHAEILSEGGPRDGDGAYYGSTMITIDLEALSEHWRGSFDATERARLAQAVEGSVRVRLRAMRLAVREAQRRLADRRFGRASVETRVRLVGLKLHVDVDVELPFDVSSGGSVSR